MRAPINKQLAIQLNLDLSAPFFEKSYSQSYLTLNFRILRWMVGLEGDEGGDEVDEGHEGMEASVWLLVFGYFCDSLLTA